MPNPNRQRQARESLGRDIADQEAAPMPASEHPTTALQDPPANDQVNTSDEGLSPAERIKAAQQVLGGEPVDTSGLSLGEKYPNANVGSVVEQLRKRFEGLPPHSRNGQFPLYYHFEATPETLAAVLELLEGTCR